MGRELTRQGIAAAPHVQSDRYLYNSKVLKEMPAHYCTCMTKRLLMSEVKCFGDDLNSTPI